MSGTLSLILNILLGLSAAIVMVLAGFLFQKSRDLRNDASHVAGLTNAYEEHRNPGISVPDQFSRSANFLRIADYRLNGWLRLTHVTCPPSALASARGTTDSVLVNEAGMPTPDSLKRASAAFGDCPYERVIEVGNEAKKFVTEILESGKFRIVVRWSMNAADQTYPCFVIVTQADGSERYLHEMLIERGLGYPEITDAPGPYGESQTDFNQRSRDASEIARRRGLGGFKHELDDPAFRPPRNRGVDLDAEFRELRRSVGQLPAESASDSDAETTEPGSAVPGDATGNGVAPAVDLELHNAEEKLREAEAALRAAGGDPTTGIDNLSPNDRAATPSATEAEPVEN